MAGTDTLEFSDASFDQEVLKSAEPVLVDFWAIWCRPCIKTFPHLREWQDHYADKGLVIIGMTRYYGYEWNDAANRPIKPAKKPAEKTEGEDKVAEKEPAGQARLPPPSHCWRARGSTRRRT